uniref:Uncharacterized protein n=1 Tax=Oryza rufipogon TaxID=4529 RepID=A0A0E0PFD2_ORYRU
MAAAAEAAAEALPCAGSPCTSSRPRRACHPSIFSGELESKQHRGQVSTLHCTALLPPENTGCLQHSTDAQVFISSDESAASERLKAAWHRANWAAGKSPARRPSCIGQINIGAFQGDSVQEQAIGSPPHLALRLRMHTQHNYYYHYLLRSSACLVSPDEQLQVQAISIQDSGHQLCRRRSVTVMSDPAACRTFCYSSLSLRVAAGCIPLCFLSLSLPG